MLRQSLWSLAAALFFSLMAVFVKLLSGDFSSMELVFYRSILTVLAIAVFVYFRHYTIKTRHVGSHLVRSLLGVASMTIWFYSMGFMPLSTNMTLVYTSPLFLAFFFLVRSLVRRETLPWGGIVAIALGFVGVPMVLQPSFEAGYFGAALLCFVVAILDVLIIFQIKRLGALGEPSWRIVFYFALGATAITFVACILSDEGFHAVSLKQAFYLLAIGGCATLAQVCNTRAYALGNVLLSSCLGFSGIVFSAILGVIFFADQLSWGGIVGMGVIAFAGILATVYTKTVEVRARARNISNVQKS